MTKKVLACVGVVILLLFSTLCIPYAKTTGVVIGGILPRGVLTERPDGRIELEYTDVYLEAEFTVRGIPYTVHYCRKYKDCPRQYAFFSKGDEVEVYYNPLFPRINTLVE
jgi:hypothetical protein